MLLGGEGRVGGMTFDKGKLKSLLATFSFFYQIKNELYYCVARGEYV